MKFTRTLLLTMTAFAFAAIAAEPPTTPSPKEQAAEFAKSSKAARQAKRFAEAREWQSKIREVKDRKPEELAGSFVFDAETWLEEGGADAAKNAVEAYGKAFAVPELPRAKLDSLRLGAVKTLFAKGENAARKDAARKVSDQILADKETAPKTRYAVLMERANWAKKAKDEKALYAEAMAAAKVPGKFNRLDAYYLLAEYEFKKGQGVTVTNTDEQMGKYLKLMDQAYEAAVNEMGLAPEVIDGAVRISLCRENTKEELAQLADAFEYAKRTLKG